MKNAKHAIPQATATNKKTKESVPVGTRRNPEDMASQPTTDTKKTTIPKMHDTVTLGFGYRLDLAISTLDARVTAPRTPADCLA